MTAHYEVGLWRERRIVLARLTVPICGLKLTLTSPYFASGTPTPLPPYQTSTALPRAIENVDRAITRTVNVDGRLLSPWCQTSDCVSPAHRLG